VGGVERVFVNLCHGLDRLGIHYNVNLPFDKLCKDDLVGVLGRGRNCLAGYDQQNPIVAGIGLMTHPSEWPTLCDDYPVVRYLQHSEWANNVYRPYYGDRCAIWPVGIDTDFWRPAAISEKSIDFLIYDKVRWEHDSRDVDLITPIRTELARRGLSSETLQYGYYEPGEYRKSLGRCRAMIFLAEHESQGLAAQEAMSSGLPLLAWDPGFVLDPERFAWGEAVIPASSVPYFDTRCGLRFRDANEFLTQLPKFCDELAAGHFAPRSYILENLTLEKCASHFLDILRASGNSE